MDSIESNDKIIDGSFSLVVPDIVNTNSGSATTSSGTFEVTVFKTNTYYDSKEINCQSKSSRSGRHIIMNSEGMMSPTSNTASTTNRRERYITTI